MSESERIISMVQGLLEHPRSATDCLYEEHVCCHCHCHLHHRSNSSDHDRWWVAGRSWRCWSTPPSLKIWEAALESIRQATFMCSTPSRFGSVPRGGTSSSIFTETLLEVASLPLNPRFGHHIRGIRKMKRFISTTRKTVKHHRAAS